MKQDQSPEHNESSMSWRSAGLFAVRYGIGGAIVAAGVVVLAVVPGDMGALGFASAVGAGLSVVLLNFLYRLSVSGDREREREEEARRYLDEHGVWPDDEATQERRSTRRGSYHEVRSWRSRTSGGARPRRVPASRGRFRRTNELARAGICAFVSWPEPSAPGQRTPEDKRARQRHSQRPGPDSDASCGSRHGASRARR
jgi:hypothetical protein